MHDEQRRREQPINSSQILSRIASAEDMRSDEQHEHAVEHMQHEVDQVIAEYLLRMDLIIDRKREVEQRPGGQQLGFQEIAEVDAGIRLDGQEVVENKWNIERIPVRAETQNGENRKRKKNTGTTKRICGSRFPGVAFRLHGSG